MQKRPFFDNVIAFFFVLAGLYNIVGILYPTQFFFDQTIATVDPTVFSWLGQVNIVLWGLAYLSVSFSFYKVPKLVFIFFIEKMVYAIIWGFWYVENGHLLPELADTQPVLANVFQFYGLGDLFFGLFFFYVVIRCSKDPKISKPESSKPRIEPTLNPNEQNGESHTDTPKV